MSPLTLKAGDRLVLASANRGKLQELQALLADYRLDIVPISDFYPYELAEDGTTFEANALQKARFAHQLTGLPALADDSGFCVAALDGQPGVYSARWAGDNKDFTLAMQQVHDKMKALTKPMVLDAHFVCVLALVKGQGEGHPYDTEHRPQEAVFRGEVSGQVAWPPRGDQGFGYDPMFVPEGYHQTFGEMTTQQKDLISHRHHAFTAFRDATLVPTTFATNSES